MNTPRKNQPDSASTVTVRIIMYCCVTAVVLMDLVPQYNGWSSPSYRTYAILAVLVFIAEAILRHDKRNPGIW